MTRNTELLSIEKVQEIMKRHAEHLDLMHSRFGPEGNSLMRYDADDQALTALKPLGLDLARLCLSLAAQLQQERETLQSRVPIVYKALRSAVGYMEGEGWDTDEQETALHVLRLMMVEANAAEAPAGRDT